MYYYSYEAFESDMRAMLPACREYDPDMIVALARGGLIGAQLLGYGLGVRDIAVLRVASYDDASQRQTVSISGECSAGARRILIVDDIVDSGKTLQSVRAYLKARHPEAQIKCAAPWYKPTACEQPEFTVREATEWIEFFWDRFDA